MQQLHSSHSEIFLATRPAGDVHSQDMLIWVQPVHSHDEIIVVTIVNIPVLGP